jgi:hypothetical protein
VHSATQPSPSRLPSGAVGVRSRARVRSLARATPLAAVAAALAAGAALAQWEWRRAPPRFSGEYSELDGGFAFCRALYTQVRREYLGHGWDTDYPDSDYNLSVRLSEVTLAPIRRDSRGEPDHVVVRFTDEELFAHPFLFLSDAGTVGLSPEEAQSLRRYLLKGGFLWADDFWGDAAWAHWQSEIAAVLPEYPIVDLPLDHPIFHVFFDVDEVPQVPSIQHWRRSGGETSEMGSESAEPHLRGILDERGRLLVLMSHNTDIADGWEREGESVDFFELFSVPKSYPLGINVALHSLLR